MAEQGEEAQKKHPERWMGPYPDLYRPDWWLSAGDIAVARFSQILIWPLVLRPSDAIPNRPGAYRIDETYSTLRGSGLWVETEDLLDHCPGDSAEDQAQSYAEFVYFHDYVQSVLFRPRVAVDDRAPLRLFRRSDVEAAEIVIGDLRFRAEVKRCNLYVFQSEVAILAVELDFGRNPTVAQVAHGAEPRPLTLALVQDFVDKSRRCYAPYFSDGAAQAVPTSVTWFVKSRDRDEESKLGPFQPARLSDELVRIRDAARPEARTAPVLKHWIELLRPLTIAGYERSSSSEPVWRQIIDERIPAMSYVSLTGAGRQHYQLPRELPSQPMDKYEAMQDLRVVKRGDWVRLCYAEDPGSASLPYDPDFLSDFEKTACYDRHFPSEAMPNSTRFMFAGYHAAAVGAGRFFDETLIHHFRRHYFQMGLILQMEFASLLAISSHMSTAVRKLHEKLSDPSPGNDAQAYSEFRDSVIRIEESFLEVLHLFRFTGLSNQIQAREMYDKWRKALGTEALFDDLKDELAGATQFLLSKEQLQRADTANNLSTIAAIGVVLGLAFSFLGMNVLMSDDTIGNVLNNNDQKAWRQLLHEFLPLGIVVTLSCSIGLLISWCLGPRKGELDRSRLMARRILWAASAIGGICIVVGLSSAHIVRWVSSML